MLDKNKKRFILYNTILLRGLLTINNLPQKKITLRTQTYGKLFILKKYKISNIYIYIPRFV